MRLVCALIAGLLFGAGIAISGMIDPVSSLEDGARLVGEIFPGTYFLIFSRGTFSKALGFAELSPYLLPLALSILVVVSLSVLLLDKQEH